MIPTVQLLIKDGTNVIDLKKLRNKLADKGSPEEYPDDATVTLIGLRKADDNTIVTGTANLPMVYVVGTTGKKTTYRVTLDKDTPLTVNQKYIADILAEVAGGVRPFKIPCKAVEG